ncbi:MAG: hypothetical protein P4L87_11755 [Formivibrio sp.]|nr:hypothetical protein [Formivibrio sp.]
MIRIYPEMTCCKAGRQWQELRCEGEMLAMCLGRDCAKVPSLEGRRAYAKQVEGVELIQAEGLIDSFRSHVLQAYNRLRNKTE